MQMKETSSSYAELTTQTYNVLVEAFATANRRALDYAKSVYEIASRPYASTALETTLRENFDRANQVMSLTVSELQTTGQTTAELNEKLIAHGTKFGETYAASMRGLVDTGLSNLKFAKETATQQIDEMTKRINDVSAQATAQVSSN